MTQYILKQEINPRHEDVQKLGNGIMEYASQQRGHKPIEFFAVFVRDENNEIRGGCSFCNLYGCLYVDQLWLDDSLRRKGYGTQFMQEAEKIGREQGCTFATVNTMDKELYASDEVFNNKINFNDIKLIPATLKEHPVIQNMGRFYVYGMSEYLGKQAGWEIPEDGLYECIDFKKYWEDKNSFPFLVRYKSEIAGFVIVDKKGSNAEVDFNMAQFFILRKFKSKSIGKYVAQECFKKFPGVWEVMVIPGNEGAYRFWRATIKDYTHNNFTEYTRDIAHFNNSRKNIFKFDSRVVS